MDYINSTRTVSPGMVNFNSDDERLFYGKKPEYPVACCRDEWQAGYGGGNPQVLLRRGSQFVKENGPGICLNMDEALTRS